VSLFYDSIMFILIKHIMWDKTFEVIEDSINVSTDKNYARYPPPPPDKDN
jgi:hypothetical protein